MRQTRNNFIQRSLMGALSFLKESVFSDEYSSKQGFLQARDPRLKGISIFVLLLAVLFSNNLLFLVGMYMACLLLACASKIRIGFFLKRTWIFIPLFSLFIALPALLNIFSPGEPLVNFNIFSASVSITRQGVASVSFFFMRVLTSVSLCVVLVLTTKHYSLLKVLRVFRVPQVFVMTLGMSYRYIYLFVGIIQDTYLAIKSRVGFIPSVRKGQRVAAWNIAMLWQRSYQMHYHVYQAMCARGYSGEPKTMDESSATVKDWTLAVAAVLILAISLWQNYYFR